MRILGAAIALVVGAVGCNAVLGIGEPNITNTDGTSSARLCIAVPQTGCAPTETCRPQTKTTAVCVAAGGNPEGLACTDERNCAAGLLCANGACHRPCNNPGGMCTGQTPTKCVPYEIPAIDGGVPAQPAPGASADAGAAIGVCLVDCDLTKVNSCGGIPGTGAVASCRYIDDQSTDCQVAARNHADATCADLPKDPAASCKPGYVCIAASVAANASRCRRWCRLGEGCGNGACTAFPDKVVLDGAEHGFCPAD
jgi:hypothetical protein